MLHNGEEHQEASPIYNYWSEQKEYMDEETEALNKKGTDDLNDL